MRVEIDGIRYVHDTEVQPMADGAQREALAPGLSGQCEDDVEIMLGVVDPEFGKGEVPDGR